jgi:glycosyltransferase involved in cell wall biosynthesis
VRAATAAGYAVDVVAISGEREPSTELVEGATVVRLPWTHRRGAGVYRLLWEYLGFTAAASVRVALRMLRRRYDIIQIHNPPDFLALAAVVPWLLGARVIVDIHDLSGDMFAMRFGNRRGAEFLDRLLRVIERSATRFADVVITVHEPYRRELASRGVPPAKIQVVMNTVDERLLPDDELQPDDRSFRVVYHGSLTPHYGVQLIVEAAAELAHEIDDIRVEIYGEGDLLPDLEARALELGIVDCLMIGGRLPQEEVLKRVRAATVGVVPNLPWRLNQFALSGKLFEYVVLGVPAVCADLPTLREHFSDDEVLFFRPGDARSLAAALRLVFTDRAAASARAAAARTRYEREYKWAANQRRYLLVLDRLMRLDGRVDNGPSAARGSRRAARGDDRDGR